MSTTLDSEEERVIEAGKEEWRQRAGSRVLDIRILPSPNERHMGEVGEERKRREEWEFSGRRADEGGERVHKPPQHLTYLEIPNEILIILHYYVNYFYKNVSSSFLLIFRVLLGLGGFLDLGFIDHLVGSTYI